VSFHEECVKKLGWEVRYLTKEQWKGLRSKYRRIQRETTGMSKTGEVLPGSSGSQEGKYHLEEQYVHRLLIAWFSRGMIRVDLC
jgi:hypothetical protein